VSSAVVVAEQGLYFITVFSVIVLYVPVKKLQHSTLRIVLNEKEGSRMFLFLLLPDLEPGCW
jgi:hypothetical protein